MTTLHFLPITTRSQWRQWLTNNHATAQEAWIHVSRGQQAKEGELWYFDAIEEALCFGWIDAIQKKIDGTSYQRWCPRRKNSHWSVLNRARCERLERIGLMTDAGRKALQNAKPFEIEPDILAVLQQDQLIWKHFKSLPKLYREVRIDGIQSTRHITGNADKQLSRFLESLKEPFLYGQWNDGGKLL